MNISDYGVTDPKLNSQIDKYFAMWIKLGYPPNKYNSRGGFEHGFRMATYRALNILKNHGLADDVVYKQIGMTDLDLWQ